MYPLWTAWPLPWQKARLSTVGRQIKGNVSQKFIHHQQQVNNTSHQLTSHNKPLQTAKSDAVVTYTSTKILHPDFWTIMLQAFPWRQS